LLKREERNNKESLLFLKLRKGIILNLFLFFFSLSFKEGKRRENNPYPIL